MKKAILIIILLIALPVLCLAGSVQEKQRGVLAKKNAGGAGPTLYFQQADHTDTSGAAYVGRIGGHDGTRHGENAYTPAANITVKKVRFYVESVAGTIASPTYDYNVRITIVGTDNVIGADPTGTCTSNAISADSIAAGGAGWYSTDTTTLSCQLNTTGSYQIFIERVDVGNNYDNYIVVGQSSADVVAGQAYAWSADGLTINPYADNDFAFELWKQ